MSTAKAAPISVLIPSVPPENGATRIDLPAEMTPEQQATFIKELGKFSTQVATTEARNDERFTAVNARLKKLEERADASGAHDITALQKALEQARGESNKLKWWLLGIVGSLIVSGVAGTIGYFLSR